MAVQKALAEKGREFDKQRREKRFNNDAISSSSFNFEDEKTNIEKENSKENKELVIGKKKIERKDDKEEEDEDKDEKEKQEKEVVREKKKSKGGLKLTKRKNFG